MDDHIAHVSVKEVGGMWIKSTPQGDLYNIRVEFTFLDGPLSERGTVYNIEIPQEISK